MNDRAFRLAVLDGILGCTKCPLHETPPGPIPFSGASSNVAVMGGSPTIETPNLGLEDVFAFNAVSCATPGRRPTSDELNACSGNRAAQLELAGAQWVLVLGDAALFTVRGDLSVRTTRGHVLVSPERDLRFFVTFDPAASVSQPQSATRFWADLDLFKRLLNDELWRLHADDSCVVCGIDCEEMVEHDLHMRVDEWNATYCSACWQG